MEINAAVFRKVHEPLTIEAVEIDKPWGREVLVRTAATGVCHSDLHVVDGQGRFPLDRPIVSPAFRGFAAIARNACRATRICAPAVSSPGLKPQPRGCRKRASHYANSSAFRAMPRRCYCTRIHW